MLWLEIVDLVCSQFTEPFLHLDIIFPTFVVISFLLYYYIYGMAAVL